MCGVVGVVQCGWVWYGTVWVCVVQCVGVWCGTVCGVGVCGVVGMVQCVGVCGVVDMVQCVGVCGVVQCVCVNMLEGVFHKGSSYVQVRL